MQPACFTQMSSQVWDCISAITAKGLYYVIRTPLAAVLVYRITAGVLLTVRLVILSAVGACCCITNSMSFAPPFELAAFCPANFAGLCKGLFPLLIIQNKSLLQAQFCILILLESRAATRATVRRHTNIRGKIGVFTGLLWHLVMLLWWYLLSLMWWFDCCPSRLCNRT